MEVKQVISAVLTERSLTISQRGIVKRLTESGTIFPKYPSEVMTMYPPSLCEIINRVPERAYAGKSPTIGELIELHGESIVCQWVEAQIIAIYASSANRDAGAADGIKSFAICFTGDIRPYKVSEMLLFFARYKVGKYDSSFSSFDTRRIGYCFFHDFLAERRIEISTIERNNQQTKVEEHIIGGVTYEQYLNLKRRAEAGDKQAIEQLKPP